MNDVNVLYGFILMLMTLSSIHNQNKVNVNQVRNFSANHLQPSIVIPLLQMLYGFVEKVVFYVIEGNMLFGNLMQTVYETLTDAEYISTGLILHSLEVVYMFFIMLLYYIVCTGFVSFFSNIQDTKDETILIGPALVFLFLLAFVLRVFRKRYKKNPKGLKKLVYGVIIGCVSMYSIMYTLSQHVRFDMNTKISHLYNSLYENNKHAVFSHTIKRYARVVGPLMKDHFVIAATFQILSAVLFVFTKNRNYDKKAFMKKELVLINLIALSKMFYTTKFS